MIYEKVIGLVTFVFIIVVIFLFLLLILPLIHLLNVILFNNTLAVLPFINETSVYNPSILFYGFVIFLYLLTPMVLGHKFIKFSNFISFSLFALLISLLIYMYFVV